jgi:hypothetical protein
MVHHRNQTIIVSFKSEHVGLDFPEPLIVELMMCLDIMK